MTELTMANFTSWFIQAALLAITAAVLARVLHIDAPVVRYAWWRVVLAVCLALPLVQPWQPQGLTPVTFIDASSPLPPLAPEVLSTTSARTSPVRRPPQFDWKMLVTGVVVSGVVLRLGWLVVGLIRLRRLRRAGDRADDSGAPETLQALVAAGAEVRYVGSLRQPVTFGIRRPVVLLPDALRTMAPAIQRAVLVHELWHVRRRDWTWTLGEEVVRAGFWFHPAIWYLVSRVQGAREEVVDELSVLATNARRSYLEALLAFADEPAVHPAAPFARRRQLFNRMLLISREAVMSPRRIVCSAAGMAGALVIAGWYGSLAFPLTAMDANKPPLPVAPPPGFAASGASLAPMTPGPAAPAAAAETNVPSQQAQAQPRDPRPDPAPPTSSREQELQIALRADPSSVRNWLELARRQEERGAKAEVEKTLQAGVEATQSTQVLQALAGFYNRQGEFEKTMTVLEDLAARDASNPAAHQLVAVYYWEKAQKDQRLSPDQKAQYLQAGIAATDRALALTPNYVEALTYKNILLRMQANMETDQTRRQVLIAEADALRTQAMELARTRTGAAVPPAVPGAAPPPPPPPPPPPFAPFVDGVRAVRVGGNVPTPTKVRDVKPIYPPEAQEARVSGMVVVEVLIDPQGNVRQAQVLRSIPILDQAALAAVKQWEFQPTLLDGVAVPVIMTVTVNFTLD